MPITPDTKNWTWVLERRCDECGFDAADVRFGDVPAILLANAAEWPALLARPDARERPDDDTWSTLEYAAHVCDVLRINTERLALMLAHAAPTFDDWDQDATAIADDYRSQDPREVEARLSAAAETAAAAFGSVADSQLDRPGLRSDGSAFTVESLARYFVHDPVHHLHDVRRVRPSGS